MQASCPQSLYGGCIRRKEGRGGGGEEGGGARQDVARGSLNCGYDAPQREG